MKHFALPKADLLRKPGQYQEIYRQGKRIRGESLTIIHRANTTGRYRLGISAHGFKKASQRNRIKRIIREYFRLNREQLAARFNRDKKNQARDLIFAVRRGFAPATPGEIADYLDILLGKRS